MFQGRISLDYEPIEALRSTIDLRLATDQQRTGPFESPIKGYRVLKGSRWVPA